MAPFFETQNQAWVFLGLMYLGLALGVVYDGLRAIRLPGKKVATALCDLLFFLLAGLSLTLALVVTGQDGLRLYALLGLIAGGILYIIGVRALVLRVVFFLNRLVVQPIAQALARRGERKSAARGRKQA